MELKNFEHQWVTGLSLLAQKVPEGPVTHLDLAKGVASPEAIQAYNRMMPKLVAKEVSELDDFNWITFSVSWAYLNRDKFTMEQFFHNFQQAIYDQFGFTLVNEAVYACTGILGAILSTHFGDTCYLLTDYRNDGFRRIILS